MAGDAGEFQNDHSRADFALCCLLAKRYGANAFRIDQTFRRSKLYRKKWERDDYRKTTISRAIKAVAGENQQVDDGRRDEDEDLEYLVCSWFPKGEVSLIGAPVMRRSRRSHHTPR